LNANQDERRGNDDDLVSGRVQNERMKQELMSITSIQVDVEWLLKESNF